MFELRSLSDHELSYESSASSIPLVVTPVMLGFEGGARDFVAYLSNNAREVKRKIAENGAILFRGFPVGNPWEYQYALKALGYDLYKSNQGGASPRRKVTDETFMSTEAPPHFIIGFHTEFCYQSIRPGMISFYCSETPSRHGETPLFDCSAVLENLSHGLRAKLVKHGVVYRRFFSGNKPLFKFRKTWQDAFGAQERGEVEAYLVREGMRYQWDADGNLATELNLPAVLTDPLNGNKYLSLTMFNGDSFIYNFRHFRERYNPLVRRSLEWFVRRECARKDCFLHVSFGDGRPFTRDESEEIQKAAWNSAIIFRWQPNDFVIIDNIRFAHSRLNVRKPRAIVAAMADAYDVREYASPVRTDAILSHAVRG